MSTLPSLLLLVLLAALLSPVYTTASDDLLHRSSVRAPCGTNRLEQCSFIDRFKHLNKKRWVKTSGYANGPPFASWWAASNVLVDRKARVLALAITKRTDFESGLNFASGELKSKGRYGYGCYEARMAPISKPGVITAFFIYTDRFNALKGRPKRINSVNLGFLYQPAAKTFSYRMTFTTNGVSGPVQDVYPPYDISKEFHNYGFKFTSSGISWYLDGNLVFRSSHNIPKASSGPFRIFLNTWVVSPTAGYGGKFIFRGRGVTRIAAIRYIRGNKCTFKKSF